MIFYYLATSELFQPIAAEYDMKKNHPKISEYMERVKAKTQPHYDETFRRIEYVKDRIAEGIQWPEIIPTDPKIL